MKRLSHNLIATLFLSMGFATATWAQAPVRSIENTEGVSGMDSELQIKTKKQKENEQKNAEKPSKLTFGGYGEAVMTRNFYSDNVFRYSHAEDYKNAHSNGQFDLPHVVFMIGYDFGKGWSMGSEIEFEHGGTEAAVEMEAEETGEYETEVERGGEVALEQFWIQKSFSKEFNIKMGHIIVPIGYTNGNHLSTQFFTVYRPEGENTIMPCTWHETGISLWGEAGDWRYEIMLLPGLNSNMFTKDRWINQGSASAFEFRTANTYAGAFRLDNYSIKGLRIGISGYYGHSFHNSVQTDFDAKEYKNVKGAVAIGAIDFDYKDHNWIVRGNFDYGHLGDAEKISKFNQNLMKTSPYPRTQVGKSALCGGIEAGYNLFSQFQKLNDKNQKLYLFGRYEYYDAYKPATKNTADYPWTERHRIAAGLNYYPMKQIVIKGEYSARFLKSRYNNEPSVSLSIAYAGFFTR